MKGPTATFAGIAARWPMPVTDDDVFWDEALLVDLFSPERRQWFEACVHELRQRVSKPSGGLQHMESLVPQLPVHLAFNDPILRINAKAHLSVCKALIGHDRTMAQTGKSLVPLNEDEVSNINKDTGVSKDLVARLAEEMCDMAGDSAQPSRPSVTITVPVVETIQKGATPDQDVTDGTLASLKLELFSKGMRNGIGNLYPSPAMAFVKLDRDFVIGTENASKYVRDTASIWRDQGDVLWTLTRPSKPLPLEIVGPSAGAGFAIGLATLLAGRGDGNSRFA